MKLWLKILNCSQTLLNAKPHPEALLTAIEKLNAYKDSVLYVGDSIIDAKTAQVANVDFIAVTTGTTEKDEFMQFPFIAVVGTLSELLGNDTFARCIK